MVDAHERLIRIQRAERILHHIYVDIQAAHYLVDPIKKNAERNPELNTPEKRERYLKDLAHALRPLQEEFAQLQQAKEPLPEHQLRSLQNKLQLYYQLVSDVEGLYHRASMGEEYDENEHAMIEELTVHQSCFGELQRLNLEQKLHLPNWIMEYLNHVNALETTYIEESDDPEKRFRELDDDYMNLMEKTAYTANEERLLSTVMGELLLRTARHRNDKVYDDADTNIHSIKNLCDEIIRLWQRFPPVAKKYQLLKDNIENMVQLLEKYYDAHTEAVEASGESEAEAADTEYPN